jgi:hypothetical protein
MWNIRNVLAMAIIGVGLAFVASSPASAQASGAYGYGYPGGYGVYPVTYWGWRRYFYRPGGLFDVGWEGSGYGWGNNWGYLEVTPSRRIAPPVVTLRPPA